MMLLVFAVSSVLLNFVTGQSVSAICEDINVAGQFKVIFNYDREGTTTATGLESYDASENPNFDTIVTGADCSTTTLTNDIYTISYTVDTTSLKCGIQQDGGDPSVYKFAISPSGIEKVYTFQCDTDALMIPTVVEINDFHTEHVDKEITLLQNELDVKGQVVLADQTQVPPEGDVRLGQPILLRLILDYGFFDQRPDMCGTSFHLSPIHHSDTTIKIFTKGLGTRVKITGKKAGNTFEEILVVKRETPAIYAIPTSYAPTGTAAAWTKHDGIKIEGIDDKVCVLMKEETEFAVLTVFPDHFLGNSYRAVDYMGRGSTSSNFFITATVDGTDVTFDLTQCTFSGLTIDGTSALAAPITLTLNALQSLHAVCDGCSCMTISSTENIAVVHANSIPDETGGSSKEGFSMNQIPPIKYLDTEFVIPPTHTAYDTTSVISTDTVGEPRTYSTNTATMVFFTNEKELDESSERLSVTDGVYAFQILSETSCSSPAVQLLGRRQWNTHYDVHVYDLTNSKFFVDIIVEDGEIGNIFMRTDSSDAVITATAVGSTIVKLGANPLEKDYKAYRLELTATGHYVIYTKDATKSFYLIASERQEVGAIDDCTSYLSFGTTFGQIFPCITSTTGSPGNKLDDNCNTFNDEYSPSSSDANNDLAMASDLVLQYRIVVVSLIVADNSAFTGPNVATVHTDGCNVITTGDSHATIGAFEKNDALNSVYDDLWVMDTPTFRAYRWRGSSDVYYRIYFEPCLSDANDCKKSCKSRRKRSTTENLQHVDLKLTVSNTRYSDTSEAKAWRCTAAKIYWVPHALLLLMIAIEVSATGYFLYIKYKLMME